MTRTPITEDDLHAYIDAALPPERREEVARYLEDHPDVAARIHAYRDQAAALARALAPVAEEPVPAELTLANLTAARRRSAWGGRELAAGLVLFALGLGSGWGLHLYDVPGEMGVLTHEAAQNYAVFGADYTRPVEMPGEDVKSLEHWLAQRMQHPVMVPDLTAAGYRLMGGRIVATGKGPGALVMYDDPQGRRLVIFCQAMPGKSGGAMREDKMPDMTGFAWADSGMGYSLVSAMTPDQLHPIAVAVRSQTRKAT